MTAERSMFFERRTVPARAVKREARTAKIEKKEWRLAPPLQFSLFALLTCAVVPVGTGAAVGQSREPQPNPRSDIVDVAENQRQLPRGRIVKVEPPLTEEDFAVSPRIASQARFERLEHLPTGVPVVTIEIDDDATMARGAAAGEIDGEEPPSADAIFDDAEAVVFAQPHDSGYFLPNKADDGNLMANQLHFTATYWHFYGFVPVQLTGFDFTVYNSGSGPGGPATIDAELWFGDPLGLVDTGCSPPGPIAGTQCTFSDLPDGAIGDCTFSGGFRIAPCVGLYKLRCRFAAPVPIPNECDRVWLAWRLTKGCRVGWRVAGSYLGTANDTTPAIGFSDYFEMRADCGQLAACETPNGRNRGFCCDNGGPTSGLACDHTNGGIDCAGSSFCTDGMAEMVTAYSLVQDGGHYASYLATVYTEPWISMALIPVGNAPGNVLDRGVSIDGNEIQMLAGRRTVFVEARMGDWNSAETGVWMKGYGLTLDSASFASGLSGSIETKVIDCDSDQVCVDAFGAGATCDEPRDCQANGVPCRCTAAFVDTSRTGLNGFVIPERAGPLCAGLVDADGMQIGCATVVSSVTSPVPYPVGGLYAGTFVLEVPADALGTFTLAIDPIDNSYIKDYRTGTLTPLLGFAPARIVIYERSEPPPPRSPNRYLRIEPGMPNQPAAIRVDFDDLPPPYDVFNGRHMFVGEPELVSETAGTRLGSPPYLFAAPLQCEPLTRYWDATCIAGMCQIGVGAGMPCLTDEDCAREFYAYHPMIVPDGHYSVSFSVFSAGPPRPETTAAWGDIGGPVVEGEWSAPDGKVEIVVDVMMVLNKFANRGNVAGKARCDVDPATPDQIVDIRDVTRVLDAFRGLAYPFPPIAWPCPGGSE